MYKENLTKRQYEILKFIYRSITEESRPPTVREIGNEFSISSTKGVSDHLAALERKGWIQRDDRQARGIHLISERVNRLFEADRGIPIVGKVSAGQPTLALENIEGEIDLQELFSNRGDLFALRVEGDSMREAGIHRGDILIARKQSTADLGDIVVVIIEGQEGTVKKLTHAGEEIHLEPANPNYDTIVRSPSQVEIRGRAIGVIRKM